MNQDASVTSSDSATLAEQVDQLTRFEGPPEQFLYNMLAVQCRVASADAGTFMRVAEDGKPEILAVFPKMDPSEPAPVWLAQAGEAAPNVFKQCITLTLPLRDPNAMYTEKTDQYLIIIPLLGGGGVRGAGPARGRGSRGRRMYPCATQGNGDGRRWGDGLGCL